MCLPKNLAEKELIQLGSLLNTEIGLDKAKRTSWKDLNDMAWVHPKEGIWNSQSSGWFLVKSPQTPNFYIFEESQ